MWLGCPVASHNCGIRVAANRGLPEPGPAQFFERRAAYPWFVVGTVCIGAFIGQLDASIVQLAMPSFEDVFDAPLDAVSWVAVAYVLAFAAVLPAFARLAEIGGRKTLYLCGFALFGLFSALCGFAPSLPLLVAFRVLQGIGGSMLGANSVVILVAAAGPARRGKALGIMAAAQAVGLSLGPTLGGVLLATLGWRSIFWVSVPFAILGAALGWLIVPKTTAFANRSALRRRRRGAPDPGAGRAPDDDLGMAGVGADGAAHRLRRRRTDPARPLHLAGKQGAGAADRSPPVRIRRLLGRLRRRAHLLRHALRHVLRHVVCAHPRLPRSDICSWFAAHRRPGRAWSRGAVRRSMGGQTPAPRHGWGHGGLPRLGGGVESASHRNAAEPRRRNDGACSLWRRSRPLHRSQQQRDDRRGAG